MRPAEAGVLLAADEDEIARRARKIEGAWTYLKAMAGAVGLDDPLDDDVVHAYWVGLPLLDAVVPGDLVRRVERRFASQPGGTWR